MLVEARYEMLLHTENRRAYSNELFQNHYLFFWLENKKRWIKLLSYWYPITENLYYDNDYIY